MLAIREGLKNGFRPFFYILIGGVFVDILYANIALWGHTAFSKYIIFKLITLPIGTLVFFFIGYSQIKTLYSKKASESKDDKLIISPLITGIVMTLSNPFALIMWVTLFSSSKTSSSYLILALIILIVGLIFISLEGIVISFLKKQINANFLKCIEVFTGILLLYFACKFGYELVVTIIQL